MKITDDKFAFNLYCLSHFIINLFFFLLIHLLNLLIYLFIYLFILENWFTTHHQSCNPLLIKV